MNDVSRHSTRPYFFFVGSKKKEGKKERAFRPPKCFFLLASPAH
jgi:hypothetical protein